MIAIIHTHNNQIKSAQQFDGTEAEAIVKAKDLAEAEIERPLTDEEIEDLEANKSVGFYQGLSPHIVTSLCRFSVVTLTV